MDDWLTYWLSNRDVNYNYLLSLTECSLVWCLVPLFGIRLIKLWLWCDGFSVYLTLFAKLFGDFTDFAVIIMWTDDQRKWDNWWVDVILVLLMYFFFFMGGKAAFYWCLDNYFAFLFGVRGTRVPVSQQRTLLPN